MITPESGHAPAEVPRLAAFAVATCSVVLLYRLSPASPLWVPAALAGIALAIWHGAFDSVLAREVLMPRLGRMWRMPFYAGYVALAGVVLLIWWLAPVAALLAFLLYSALHFGTETQHQRAPLAVLSAFALGFAPIAAACCWWPAAVTPIFGIMMRGREAAAVLITAWAGHTLIPVVAFAVLGAVGRWDALVRRIALLGLELLLFRFCTPLIAFAIFFCVWHTPEHLVETSRDRLGRFQLRTMWHNLKEGLAPWLVSLCAVAVVAGAGRHIATAYAGVVFIALSALTVPHMVLGLMLGQSSSASDSQQLHWQKGAAHG